LESLLVDLTLLERQTDIRELISRLDSRGGVTNPDAGTSRRGRQRVEDTTAAATVADTTEIIPTIDIKSDTKPDSKPASPAAPNEAALATADGDNPLDLKALTELWSGFVTFVRQKKVSLGVCLIAAKLYSYEDDRLMLRFMKNFNVQKEQVSNAANLTFLGSMFEKYFGRKVEVMCISEGEEKAVAFEQAANNQKGLETQLRGVSNEKKAIVKKLMQEFDGEIIRYNR